MKNIDIRIAARVKRVPLWKVAVALGISEPTLYRQLRTELPDCKKNAMLAAIDKLSKEVE